MQNSRIYSIILVAVLAFFTLSIVSIADVTDTVTINVTIQTLSRITVQPDSLKWILEPGEEGQFTNLDIRNTGSNNVSQIHAYIDTITDETTRPYGSSVSTDYAAGGLVVLKNETDSNYSWAGRIEWNWTEDVENKDLSNLIADSDAAGDNVAWGFLKNTTFEYFWAATNGSTGYCNDSDARFGIDADLDNGTTASRTPTTTGITANGQDTTYRYYSVTKIDTPYTSFCVAVVWNCSYIYMYKYDRRSPFNTCNNAMYLQDYTLVPTEIHTLNISAWAPYGIPASPGPLNLATLAIYATAP